MWSFRLHRSWERSVAIALRPSETMFVTGSKTPFRHDVSGQRSLSLLAVIGHGAQVQRNVDQLGGRADLREKPHSPLTSTLGITMRPPLHTVAIGDGPRLFGEVGMKLRSSFLVAALTFSLQGCWFIYIPGSVTGAVSDAITGAEGSHCVGANAKVGDIIRLPGGGRATVKSLSGTSMRCTNPEHPIRALVAFNDDEDIASPSATMACETDSDCGQGNSCRSKKGGGTECRGSSD